MMGGEIVSFSFDSILPFFGIISSFVINLLPSSPFRAYIDQIGTIPYLKYLNWFVPVPEIIVVFQTWLTCYAIILSYKVLLRYIKVL